MNSKIFIIIFFMLFAYSCKDDKEKGGIKKALGTRDMEDLNVYFVKKDRERIQNYIERHNLDMKESPTGLWYQIVKEGEGEFLGENDKVVFNYNCLLLDGTKCYSSDEMGPREVVIGRTEIEAGINEGLKLLKPGAQAIFILPPYLAHGFVGDRKKIPPRAVVVYYVFILQPR